MGFLDNVQRWIAEATPLGSVGKLSQAGQMAVEPGLNAARTVRINNATAQATIRAREQALQGAVEMMTPPQKKALLSQGFGEDPKSGFAQGTENLIWVAAIAGGAYILSKF